jgi:antitoxin PrlF
MAISTVTDKGQTTVPQEVRRALNVKPRQRLTWSVQKDGSAIVRPQGRAVDLFASLKPCRRFPGRAADRDAMARVLASETLKKGIG